MHDNERKPLAIAHLSDLFNLQNYLKLQKLEICWKRVIKKVIHIVEIYYKKKKLRHGFIGSFNNIMCQINDFRRKNILF